MKKILLFALILMFGFYFLNAQQVDLKTAEKVAQNYFTAIKASVKNNTLTLVYTGKADYKDKKGKSFSEK